MWKPNPVNGGDQIISAGRRPERGGVFSKGRQRRLHLGLKIQGAKAREGGGGRRLRPSHVEVSNGVKGRKVLKKKGVGQARNSRSPKVRKKVEKRKKKESCTPKCEKYQG